jgi:DNA repair protein RecO (recombination protein O)
LREQATILAIGLRASKSAWRHCLARRVNSNCSSASRSLKLQKAMSTEKTAALVIRLADFSETSRVVTLFTRDFGKVAAIAKGAKRLKGPFEAALDLLAACQIVFIRKSTSGLDILTEAQLTQRFRPSGRDLVRLYGGYYVAELLDALTEEHDPHPELFDEAVAALELLSGDGDAVLAITRFEVAVLREIGQLPSFENASSAVNRSRTYVSSATGCRRAD